MTTATKKNITIVILVCLVGHFFWIALYGSRYLSNDTTKIMTIAQRYTFPIFHQNWNLFVPGPKNEHCLLVRFKQQQTWSAWEDILQQEYIKRRKNPCSGRDALVLLFSSNLHQVVYDMRDSSVVLEALPNKNSFKVLDYSVRQYLKMYKNLPSQTPYEIMIVKRHKIEQSTCYLKQLSIY